MGNAAVIGKTFHDGDFNGSGALDLVTFVEVLVQKKQPEHRSRFKSPKLYFGHPWV